MRPNGSINLNDLLILVAEPSPYLRKILFQILKSFGAQKLIEAGNTQTTMQIIAENRIDLLICDLRLPQRGGLYVARQIRQNRESENRTVPILMMASDAQESNIRKIRDAGVNLAIAKPIAPSALFDRLCWIAFNSRAFVETPSYFGPDRRVKIEGFPNGVGRRSADTVVIDDSVGPNMSQNELDSLFASARTGGAR